MEASNEASSSKPSSNPQPTEGTLEDLGKPIELDDVRPPVRRPSNLQIELPQPPPASASPSSIGGASSTEAAKVRRTSFGSFGRRSRTRSKSTSSSNPSELGPPKRYPALPPKSPSSRRNHDNLFSFHLPHPTPAIEGESDHERQSSTLPEFQDGAQEREGGEKANMHEGAKMAMDLAIVRQTSKEGPLDAYLPQTGPNAFHTQAYLPNPGMAYDPRAQPEADNPCTRDDYDRIGRIGGRTGVGWMACCASMLLFTCTDCCCCCC